MWITTAFPCYFCFPFIQCKGTRYQCKTIGVLQLFWVSIWADGKKLLYRNRKSGKHHNTYFHTWLYGEWNEKNIIWEIITFIFSSLHIMDCMICVKNKYAIGFLWFKLFSFYIRCNQKEQHNFREHNSLLVLNCRCFFKNISNL